ncbi:50S ribosomal protein L11 [Thermogladius sp. KZ2Tp1]|uniref:50S ribosomal protein L11 n=1 Tax=Thermogladius sp. KZ2Tp1 TaxID=3136289 RepID=UPI003DA8EF1D
MGKKVVRVMVEGGKANPGPPLGPTLSSLKLNVQEVVRAINEATKEFAGLSVPVEIHVDTSTKKYEIKVGVPTTTALLLKEAGASQFTGDPAHQKIGDLKMEQVVKVAILKKDKLTARTLRSAVKTVLGTARSIGLTVEGKDPKEVQKLVDEGFYDELLKKFESEWEKEVS